MQLPEVTLACAWQEIGVSWSEGTMSDRRREEVEVRTVGLRWQGNPYVAVYQTLVITENAR